MQEQSKCVAGRRASPAESLTTYSTLQLQQRDPKTCAGRDSWTKRGVYRISLCNGAGGNTVTTFAQVKAMKRGAAGGFVRFSASEQDKLGAGGGNSDNNRSTAVTMPSDQDPAPDVLNENEDSEECDFVIKIPVKKKDMILSDDSPASARALRILLPNTEDPSATLFESLQSASSTTVSCAGTSSSGQASPTTFDSGVSSEHSGSPRLSGHRNSGSHRGTPLLLEAAADSEEEDPQDALSEVDAPPLFLPSIELDHEEESPLNMDKENTSKVLSVTTARLKPATPAKTPPKQLLREIQDFADKLNHARRNKIKNCNGEREVVLVKSSNTVMDTESEAHFSFHLQENAPIFHHQRDNDVEEADAEDVDDILVLREEITSSRGTVRGVKNRVRAGIATFTTCATNNRNRSNKSFLERERGRVVVYTTNLGVVRETFHKCIRAKNILGTLMVRYEERDVYLNPSYREELQARLGNPEDVELPQIYVNGKWLADAALLEKLNECGELRQILRPYKKSGVEAPCNRCGGYRMIPCVACHGSKKSSHRKHFENESVTLKCMQCNTNGLSKCPQCCND